MILTHDGRTSPLKPPTEPGETNSPIDLLADALHAARERSSFNLSIEGISWKAMTPPFLATFGGMKAGPSVTAGVRSLMPQSTTTAAGVDLIRETSFTDNTAVVPTGLKPVSDFTYETVLAPVTTIANTVKLSRQVLDDVPALKAQLQGRLLYGLTMKENQQLVNGTGSNGEVVGLLPAAVATTGVTAPVAPAAMADAIATAINELTIAGYIPTGVILHPSDWIAIAKAAKTAGDSYLYPTYGAYMWGLPVVLTFAIAVGKFIVGDFQNGCEFYEREAANVIYATMNQDDFVKNMLTARAEERFAFVVYQNGAFRKAA